ncbi:MAG: CHAD domain-containing protein [Sphingobacteriaceae bacterium]|nr:MAG: CHAD domain-containing protein [Sphingobacteriaceae bacterium]
MKKKEVQKELNKLFKKMKNPVKNFVKTGNQEELHQFRIQVKKLKAMLILCSAESKNQHLLKDFKPVKKAFKAAGEIRNAHINLKLAEKYNLDDADFTNQQQITLNEGVESFKNKGKKKIGSIKKAQVVLQKNLHRLHNKTIRNFYQEKLVVMDAFFAMPVFDEELHNARKNIKLLLYNRKIAVKAIQHKTKFDADYLDDLQNAIGEWHDHNLAIETLAGTGKGEFAAIMDLKNSNAELEKAILEKSYNFMAKLTR